jgi:hypothetical protein
MISFEIDECTGVLTVKPEGKLEARDFMDLSQTVDPYIEKEGGLVGLIIVTEKFPGWKDLGAMVEPPSGNCQDCPGHRLNNCRCG